MRKSVLVTGAAGFIGSHVCTELLRWDYDVTILDRLDETVNLARLELITDLNRCLKDKRLKIVWWDLKSEINDNINHLLGKPDIIIHLASGSHVDRSVEDPLLFTMDNVVGTCNLLNWIRRLDYKPWLILGSTDEVFGAAINKYYGFREEDPLNPSNPYSSTKGAQEMLVRGFSSTYDMHSTIVRMTNICGPAQHKEKMIPTAIRKISQGEELEIHSDSQGMISGTRYYLDYRDLCAAIMLLLRSESTEYISREKVGMGVYHISGREEVSNLHLAEMIAGILGRELKYRFVTHTKTRPYIDFSYRLTFNKMQNLGWKPVISIKDSLEHIVGWYKNHLDWI